MTCFLRAKKERMRKRQSENKRVICVRCLLVFVLYVDRRFTFRLTRSIFLSRLYWSEEKKLFICKLDGALTKCDFMYAND